MKNILNLAFSVLIFSAFCVNTTYADAVAGNSAKDLYTQDKLDNTSSTQLVSDDTSDDQGDSQPSEMAQMFAAFTVDDNDLEEQLVACTEASITGSSQVYMKRMDEDNYQRNDDDPKGRDNGANISPTAFAMPTPGAPGRGGRGDGPNDFNPLTLGEEDHDGPAGTDVGDDDGPNDGPADKDSTTMTPEPGTMILLGFGLAGLAPFAYKRRKENA